MHVSWFWYFMVVFSHIQPRLDFDINLCGCSTQMNIDLVHIVQNHASIILPEILSRIIAMKTAIRTLRDRRDYFLTKIDV